MLLHQASDMDATVNKEVGNYMKQIFNTCENLLKAFYQIIFLQICKSYKIVPKCLYAKKTILFETHQRMLLQMV